MRNSEVAHVRWQAGGGGWGTAALGGKSRGQPYIRLTLYRSTYS